MIKPPTKLPRRNTRSEDVDERYEAWVKARLDEMDAEEETRLHESYDPKQDPYTYPPPVTAGDKKRFKRRQVIALVEQLQRLKGPRVKEHGALGRWLETLPLTSPEASADALLEQLAELTDTKELRRLVFGLAFGPPSKPRKRGEKKGDKRWHSQSAKFLLEEASIDVARIRQLRKSHPEYRKRKAGSSPTDESIAARRWGRKKTKLNSFRKNEGRKTS